MTPDSSEHTFKIPLSTVVTKAIKNSHVADIYDTRLETFDCTKVEGGLSNVRISIHHENDQAEIPMSNIGHLHMKLIVPDDKDILLWKVNCLLDLQIENLKLFTNMGNLVKLTLVIDENGDEESPFIKNKPLWYKNIDMNFEVASGAMQMTVMKIQQEAAGGPIP